MINSEIISAYKDLLGWLIEKKFKGYDPYDGANSKYSVLNSNRIIRLLLVYFNKFSPLNFRKILGIEKRQNLYALAYFIQACYNKSDILPVNIKDIIEKKTDYIISKSLIHKFGYHCWNGNDMFIQLKNELQTPYMPGIIGTEACSSALLAYYRNNASETHIKDILFSSRDFFINELFTEYNGISFFRYKPITPVNLFIYNASLIAALYILKLNNYFDKTYGNETALKCFRKVLDYQNEDGSWYYGINLDTKKEDKQIDFHQGYILDCLSDYLNLFPDDIQAQNAYEHGMGFFFNRQFMEDGMGYYRYPRKKYPANIQNQSQGIITMSKYARYKNAEAKEAINILDWTFRKMYNKKTKKFSFLKYRFVTNKISYLRWNQASMFYALSELLKKEENQS